jgi:hypothetical protein
MIGALDAAEGEAQSPELELLAAVDRFGAQAVFGRPLGVGEIKRMRMAEDVVKAYASRAKAGDWVAWADGNPRDAALLAWAYRARDGASMESDNGTD